MIITKIYWSTRLDHFLGILFGFFNITSYRSEERGLSRKHIIESVKASLQRLQVPYIDIIIIHKADAMCPMEGISFNESNFPFFPQNKKKL